MVLASPCFKYTNRYKKQYMESYNNGVNISPCGMKLIHLISEHVTQHMYP